MNFAVYDANTGRILSTLVCADKETAKAQEGASILCGRHVSPATHFVALNQENPEVVERTQLDTSNRIEGLTVTFSGLVPGLVVNVAGVEAITDSEPMSVEFSEPGTYQVRISGQVSFMDEIVEVTLG